MIKRESSKSVAVWRARLINICPKQSLFPSRILPKSEMWQECDGALRKTRCPALVRSSRPPPGSSIQTTRYRMLSGSKRLCGGDPRHSDPTQSVDAGNIVAGLWPEAQDFRRIFRFRRPERQAIRSEPDWGGISVTGATAQRWHRTRCKGAAPSSQPHGTGDPHARGLRGSRCPAPVFTRPGHASPPTVHENRLPVAACRVPAGCRRKMGPGDPVRS